MIVVSVDMITIMHLLNKNKKAEKINPLYLLASPPKVFTERRIQCPGFAS